MSSAWQKFAEPQARLDALRMRAVRAGGTAFADLGYANGWDGALPALKAALHAAIDADDPLGLQYTPYGGATVARRVAAGALAAATGVPFSFRHMVLTPGAMSALSLVFRLLGEQGGNVVIPVPTWLDHPLYAALHGLTPRLVPTRGPDFALDVDAIATAIDRDTRAVVLTHPGNPTGSLLDAQALSALNPVLEEHRALVIADECHRDYVFGDDRFEPIVRHVPRTITVYSYGKRLMAQGQRLGYAAVSPALGAELAEQLIMRARALGIATPTALMQRVLPDLELIRPPLERIAARRGALIARLQDAGVEVASGPATMFVYARAPRGDAWAATEALAERGVLVCPAELFHAEGWVRLATSATDAMLDRGLSVAAQVLARQARGA
jgi:aspartate/methionine/tyrosine aminotransferase